MKVQIKFGVDRRLIEFLSEPYVIFTRLGFQPAIEGRDVHSGEAGFLVISASSLGHALHDFSLLHNSKMTGMTLSIRKESADRMSKYLVDDPVSEQ